MLERRICSHTELQLHLNPSGTALPFLPGQHELKGTLLTEQIEWIYIAFEKCGRICNNACYSRLRDR